MNTQRGNVLRAESADMAAPVVRNEAPMGLDEACEPTCENRPMAANDYSNMRGVTIEPLNYGYIVQVGCQKFAIETPERLIEGLSKYIKNPSSTEKEWMANHTF